MTPIRMCVISDTHLLQMALGFMQFLSFLYIFGVGFGVARFDKQAMPEPRDVDEQQLTPHVFFVYI